MKVIFHSLCRGAAKYQHRAFLGRAPGYQHVAQDEHGIPFPANELDIYAELKPTGALPSDSWELHIAYTRCVAGVHTPVTGVCEQFEAYLVYSFLSRQWRFDGFSPSVTL